MGNSTANLLEFLEICFSEDMDLWSASSTDEDAVRSIARQYPPSHQQKLLAELEALLASAKTDSELLEIARLARMNYLLDESSVREWLAMIRDQVRVVVAAAT
jgi:hypothetical protein